MGEPSIYDARCIGAVVQDRKNVVNSDEALVVADVEHVGEAIGVRDDRWKRALGCGELSFVRVVPAGKRGEVIGKLFLFEFFGFVVGFFLRCWSDVDTC